MTDISQTLKELLLARAAGEIDAEEFERRQAALHAQLLSEPTSTPRGVWRWVLAATVVAGAAGLYLWWDKPAAPPAVLPEAALLPTMPPMTALPGDAQQTGNGGDLKTMADRLAGKLLKDPGNGEGWALLAQTYVELRRAREADEAFAKAAALQALDANMLAEWADAHVVANDRKWDAQGRDLVARALAADPKQLKALSLAGSEAFERGDYKKAIDYWQRIRAAAPADSMDVRLAEANIVEAKAMQAGGKPKTAPAAAVTTGIGGTVALAPALKPAPGDTVFVIAKAVDGGGAPLAVKRFTVADLPAQFSLTDADAMVPARTISGAGEVMVSARLSKTGDAMPQAGDVASNAVRAKVGNANIQLQLGG